MNINLDIKSNYKILSRWLRPKNKPNSKPIKPKTKPIKANFKAKQTQFQTGRLLVNRMKLKLLNFLPNLVILSCPLAWIMSVKNRRFS